MAVTLRPPKEQLRDLLRLINDSGDKLDSVAAALEASDTKPLRPEELKTIVSQVLPVRAAGTLVKQLLSMMAVSRRLGLPFGELDEVVGALKRPIEDENGSEISNWDVVASALVRALKSKPVRMTSLAVELSYEYANLLRNTRILSDIRPLFDADASSVEAAVVSFTLRLQYDSADGEHDMSVVLDESDVQKLAEQCKRALKKAETAKTLMESISVRTIIAGQSQGAAND